MGVFPDRTSIYRLLGTQLVNVDEDWRAGRCYMAKEGIQKLYDPELEKNTINDNFAALGGGMLFDNSSPEVRRCTVSHNYRGPGSGIYIREGGRARISASIVSFVTP